MSSDGESVERIKEKSSFRRQLEKSDLYLVTTPQEGNIVGGKEKLSSSNIPSQCSSSHVVHPSTSPPKQRRHGVSIPEVQTDQSQRKRKVGITENKQSYSDRTCLRVLHKKF